VLNLGAILSRYVHCDGMPMIDLKSSPWTYVLNEPTHMLIVDDDPILCEFANVHLSTPTTRIDTAGDGLAALRSLEHNSYDIVILDIEMPHADGFSVLEKIRSDIRLKCVPVIMLTGHDDIASIDRCYQLGADSFATKPVNWRQLSYQIRYVIRSVRAETRRPANCAGAGSEMYRRAATAAIPDACNLLHLLIAEAEVLDQHLSADDRRFCAETLNNLRILAHRALTRPAGQGSFPTTSHAPFQLPVNSSCERESVK
jgi:DNA-binding response OmpR family regulator